MIWKIIGSSVIGTAHVSTGKTCEDSIAHTVYEGTNGATVLCCIADGAGSAIRSASAAAYCTKETIRLLTGKLNDGASLTEDIIYEIAEQLFEGLMTMAETEQLPLAEYLCTWLGCCICNDYTICFQLGDGAIIYNDGTGFFNPVWWPQTGEYYNFTTFLADQDYPANLRVIRLQAVVEEVAMFTDGLQLLCLNFEQQTVHQPFFNALFGHLRSVSDAAGVAHLEQRLGQYLSGEAINSRTDDDKTLFLASKQVNSLG